MSESAENALIVRLKAAIEGSTELDRAIAVTIDAPTADYTTSFSAARSLLPASITNFVLFSFGGGGRNDIIGDCWGCKVHDRAQLVGAERAQRNVRHLYLPSGLDKEPTTMLEHAIAEHFCEFSVTHAATPCLAICGVAIKVRIGQTIDDDLWT